MNLFSTSTHTSTTDMPPKEDFNLSGATSFVVDEAVVTSTPRNNNVFASNQGTIDNCRIWMDGISTNFPMIYEKICSLKEDVVVIVVDTSVLEEYKANGVWGDFHSTKDQLKNFTPK